MGNYFKDFVQECVLKNGSLLTTELSNGEDLFSDKNLSIVSDFLKAFRPEFTKKNKEAKEKNSENKYNKAKVWRVCDIFNGAVFCDDFTQIKSNYENLKESIIKILLHCYWLMYLKSDQQHMQITLDGYYKDDINQYFSVDREWSAGETFTRITLDSLLFIILLIKQIKKESTISLENCIQDILKLCNDDTWKKGLVWADAKSISSDSIVNIMLFLCDPEHYLPIPAQNKKQLINNKLKDLVTNENMISDLPKEMSDIDKNLFAIRKKLLQVKNSEDKSLFSQLNPFWDERILPFWDETVEQLNNKTLSDESLLKYKKAMVLYGPPGTSKSFQARRIAEGMVAKALFDVNNKDIVSSIDGLQDCFASHIHILQMHPSYTYEDFIIGKSIDNNTIILKFGELFRIINSIEENDKIPHFIILDEINRVDISRVFGELFTAMEPSYRNKGIELSIDINGFSTEDRKGIKENLKDNNKLILKIPENMYFIGTMNMIDFSLEQVDFALRRRFLWRLSTYDSKRLIEIISEKVKQKSLPQPPEDYFNCCTALNNEIEWENSLGEDYLIGHSFFTEIVDIYFEVNDWDTAKNILWQVSIMPTLKAYCGTMDKVMKEDFIKKCGEAFKIS